MELIWFLAKIAPQCDPFSRNSSKNGYAVLRGIMRRAPGGIFERIRSVQRSCRVQRVVSREKNETTGYTINGSSRAGSMCGSFTEPNTLHPRLWALSNLVARYLPRCTQRYVLAIRLLRAHFPLHCFPLHLYDFRHCVLRCCTRSSIANHDTFDDSFLATA